LPEIRHQVVFFQQAVKALHHLPMHGPRQFDGVGVQGAIHLFALLTINVHSGSKEHEDLSAPEGVSITD
jgi:hypothetical protein